MKQWLQILLLQYLISLVFSFGLTVSGSVYGFIYREEVSVCIHWSSHICCYEQTLKSSSFPSILSWAVLMPCKLVVGLLNYDQHDSKAFLIYMSFMWIYVISCFFVRLGVCPSAETLMVDIICKLFTKFCRISPASRHH